MIELCQHSEPKARKDYECMSSFYVNECNIRQCTFTFTEWRAIIKARDNNWTIKKGDKYVYQRNMTDEGVFYTFRAIPEMHEICLKYDYYIE